MKLLRPLLFGLGIVAALLVAAVLLAFTPAVQTWAVRRVLAQQPGLQAEVGRVAAGLGTVRLENLRLRMEGAELILPLAEIDLPVVSAAMGGRIAVSRLVAKGWSLDLVGTPALAARLRPSAPVQAGYLAFLTSAQAQGVPAAVTFDGIFSRLALPVDLSLDGTDLEGEIRFARAAGQSPARARIGLVGGGLAPGSSGRFVLSSEIAVDDASSPVDRVVARQEVLLRMDAPRSLDRIEVTGAATATGPQFPNGVRVDIETSATRVTSGETYGFTLRSGNRVLLGVNGELPAGAEAVRGTWALDARSEDLSAFALGRPIPDFTAAGTGTFSLDRGLSEIQAAGRLAATTQRLESIDSRLRAVGALRIAADFDLVSRDADIRLNRLQLEVAAAQPVLGVTLLQGVEFSRATGELRVADIASDLLRLQLNGVPLAWAQPLLGETAVTGGDVKGGFVASVRSGRLVLRPTDALSIEGLTVVQANKVIFERIDVSTRVTLDYAPTGWQADVASFSLRSGAASLAELALKAVQAGGGDAPVKVAGSYTLELPALLEQPVLSDYRGLRTGRAKGDFSASLAAVQEMAATLVLSDLAVPADVSLPAIKAELRADRLADGTITARLPVTFVRNGRNSDVMLEGVVKPASSGLSLTAALTGEQLFVEDVQILTALVPATEGGAPAVQAAPKSGPPWAGISGRVTLNLKKVIYSSSLTANAVIGTVVVGPEAITFENVSAGLPDGAGVRVAGGLAYDTRQARTYGLKADVTVSNFDPVPLFRSINPTALPPIEGRFEIATRLTGQAADLAGLAEVATGTFKLSSRGGVLRALSVDASEFGRTGTRIASVAGLIGLATGDTRALKYADRLKAASELAQQLAAVTFDQLTIELERSTDNDLVITDLSLISPTVRLLGAGRIRYEPGLAVWHQPLALQLQLGARDKLAENLKVLKLTADRADTLGYTPLLDNLQIDGTLSAFGTTMLKDRLVQALAGQ
ncbi:MAG TPA: hypothetical protein VGD88_09450 [Opitutaceae bacterium]